VPERARERRIIVASWIALSLSLLALARHGFATPGMYYDEAWLARQAQLFVEPARDAPMPPGTQSVEILGRRFPLFALPYLGSLKSQLQIAPMAMFGARLETVRATTIATAIVALLATLLAARRAFDLPTALASGALVAFDPTVFFHAQWEWGPFTSGWLCRAAGAALVLRAAQQGGRTAATLGGLALGLSVYNRADSLLVLAALAASIAVFQRAALSRLARERRAEITWAGAAFVAGAAPMIANAGRVAGTFRELATRGDFAERARTLLTTLDGSYVHRLMEQGGRFDALAEVDAPSTLMLAATAIAIVAAAAMWARARADGDSNTASRATLALACVLLACAMLALRGATRAHHMLNLAPLVHVLVASVAVALARRGRAASLAAGAAVLALLASDARSIAATQALVERTGGRGWWSAAIGELARELDATPGASAVSLDWGFHLPLAFETHGAPLAEPIWEIESQVRATGRWSTEGDAARRYVVHGAPWDRFGYGPHLLASARAVGERASIREWRDREGEVAFYTIEIPGPHRLSLERGRGFRIELR